MSLPCSCQPFVPFPASNKLFTVASRAGKHTSKHQDAHQISRMSIFEIMLRYHVDLTCRHMSISSIWYSIYMYIIYTNTYVYKVLLVILKALGSEESIYPSRFFLWPLLTTSDPSSAEQPHPAARQGAVRHLKVASYLEKYMHFMNSAYPIHQLKLRLV